MKRRYHDLWEVSPIKGICISALYLGSKRNSFRRNRELRNETHFYENFKGSVWQVYQNVHDILTMFASSIFPNDSM